MDPTSKVTSLNGPEVLTRARYVWPVDAPIGLLDVCRPWG
jgi:hypothetical protein